MNLSVEITPETAVEELVKLFPSIFDEVMKFWREEFEDDAYFRTVWGPIGRVVAERFLSGNAPETKAMLAYAEFLIQRGTETLRTSIRVWFLDAVLAKADPYPQGMVPLLEQLGPECKKYCQYWYGIMQSANPIVIEALVIKDKLG